MKSISTLMYSHYKIFIHEKCLQNEHDKFQKSLSRPSIIDARAHYWAAARRLRSHDLEIPMKATINLWVAFNLIDTLTTLRSIWSLFYLWMVNEDLACCVCMYVWLYAKWHYHNLEPYLVQLRVFWMARFEYGSPEYYFRQRWKSGKDFSYNIESNGSSNIFS
jgi:hypothetical protein